MSGHSPDSRFAGFMTLDFEASSLGPASWPVEIGLSWIASTGRVATWSSLVRPHGTWSMDEWSEQSALVHGISLDELASAPEAEAVAAETLALCERCITVSDAPEFDQHWLDALLETIGMAGAITVRDYDVATFSAFEGDHRLERVYEYLSRHSAPHRAGPDSRRLAAAWAAAAR